MAATPIVKHSDIGFDSLSSLICKGTALEDSVKDLDITQRRYNSPSNYLTDQQAPTQFRPWSANDSFATEDANIRLLTCDGNYNLTPRAKKRAAELPGDFVRQRAELLRQLAPILDKCKWLRPGPRELDYDYENSWFVVTLYSLVSPEETVEAFWKLEEREYEVLGGLAALEVFLHRRYGSNR